MNEPVGIAGDRPSREEINEQVVVQIRAIAAEFGHRLGRIDPESRLADDLGLDSMAIMNILLEMEVYYQTSFHSATLQPASGTSLLVSDLVCFIEENVRTAS
jgi:acyl carrier protein